MDFCQKETEQGTTILGIKLKSIRILPLEERKDFKEFATSLLNRQMDVIHSLHQLNTNLAFDLRYLYHPKTPNTIHIAILINVQETSQTGDISQLAMYIWRLFQINNHLLDLELINDKNELEFFIKPFEFNHFLEITRREDQIPLDSMRKSTNSEMGFTVNGPNKVPPCSEQASSSLYYAYPFSLHLDTMDRICNTLFIQNYPSLISICLKPYILQEPEETYLEQRIALCEKYAQLELGHTEQVDVQQLSPFLKLQAQELYSHCSRELVQLQDASFLQKIQIVSSEPVSWELATVTGSVLTEHAGHSQITETESNKDSFSGGYEWYIPKTSEQQKVSMDNLIRMEFTPWLPSLAPRGYEHLRYLFDVSQANAGFRLPLPTAAEFPGLDTIQYQTKIAPSDTPSSGLLLGEHHHLTEKRKIYYRHQDRRRHTYVVGQTGTGKSTLLLSMILQDIEQGQGVGLIDPHGELIEHILSNIPESRRDDVVSLSPSNYEYPFGINLLEYRTEFEKDFCVNYLIEVFDQLYDLTQTGGPMFEMYMRNALQLLLDQPKDFQPAILDVPYLFQDREFRQRLLKNTHNVYVRNFWHKEAERAGGDSALANIAPYITSKLSRFIYNGTIRCIVGQRKSSLDFRDLIDQGKILLVDLRKGLLGETNSHFLGMNIVGKLLSATLSRTDVKDKSNLRDFFLYVDEFQNLTTRSFISILSEARKYRLALTLANQYIAQLPSEIYQGIFGNVGTIISFRIGSKDAEIVSKEFGQLVSEADLMGISNWNAYIRLLLNGAVSSPFHLKSILPKIADNPELAAKINELSGQQYGKKRQEVEKEIQAMWTLEDK